MPIKKDDLEYRTHISFTIPIGLIREMRQIRKEYGIPVSRQVVEGISLYLKKSKGQ